MENFEIEISELVRGTDDKVTVVLKVLLNKHQVGTAAVGLLELNEMIGKKLSELMSKSHYDRVTELIDKLKT